LFADGAKAQTFLMACTWEADFMAVISDHAQAILDLEARQDEVLELLAELEKRVASVLAQCQVVRGEAGAGPSPQGSLSPSEPVRAAA
jgi:hypothetical protein